MSALSAFEVSKIDILAGHKVLSSYRGGVKKLSLVLLIALTIAWWFKDPENAKSRVFDLIYRVQTFVSKLTGDTSFVENTSYGEKKAAEQLANSLPADMYLIKQNVTARFLPVPGTILKGTKVKVIGTEGGKPLVTDGSKHAVVDQSALTRDVAEFPALLRAAQDGQRAQKAKRSEELEASLQQVESKIATVNSELASVRRRDTLARQDGKKHAQYGTQESFLLTEIRRQEGFREEIMKQIEALNTAD